MSRHAKGNGAGLWGVAMLSLILLSLTAGAAYCADAPATIVFLRHGEKPKAGLGQLDCQGLNRALALPRIVRRSFGKPDAIFAPDPAAVKADSGAPYDYVRPLATIEPTAIAFGLPVNAGIGFSDIAGLQAAIEQAISSPSSGHAPFVLVAWEHKIIVAVVKALMSAHNGNPADVPNWDDADFDSMYVVTVRAGDAKAAFTRKHEGLNGLSKACPR